MIYDELTLTDLNNLVEQNIAHAIIGGPTYHHGSGDFCYLVMLPDGYAVPDGDAVLDQQLTYNLCPSCGGRGSQEAPAGSGDTYIPCYACDGTGGDVIAAPPPDLEAHERSIGLAIASDDLEIPF